MRVLVDTRVLVAMARLAVCLAVYQGPSLASPSSNASAGNSMKIGKCCEPNELMVDYATPYSRCTPTGEVSGETIPWMPEFKDERGRPLLVHPEYEFKIGLPVCKANEIQWVIFHSPDPDMDHLMILPSGKLRHCTRRCRDDNAETEEGETDSYNDDDDNDHKYDYDIGSYCADKIILSDEGNTTVYAHVCVPKGEQTVMQTDDVMRRVVDPAFRAISVACYLVVAIVYFVLPQLRNLIGNIITSMTLCLVTSQCADMVRIFTQFSNHVSFLVADAVTYVSLLSAFFWLNSLGYYIWRTFRSRNIFLRVTDGRKYCYYSIYVWSSTVAMAAMAIFAHFVLDTNKPIVGETSFSAPQETIGWLGVAVFFTPVAFTILINLWFVVTTMESIRRMHTYGRIHHKMKYSFRMFVFLFVIMSVSWLFTLLSWIRHELVYCYIVVNLLQALLILYVCVFGQRRVTFLLRKTCNCCSPGEKVQDLDWGDGIGAHTGESSSRFFPGF